LGGVAAAYVPPRGGHEVKKRKSKNSSPAAAR
jgi:hypothetical protein